MGKITNAIYEIYELDEMAQMNTKVHQLHPLVKLIVTLVYITTVVSFGKYSLLGLVPMLIYPLMVFNLAEISIKSCFKKMKIVLPVVCFVGIFNPFFDKVPVLTIGEWVVTGGMISMVTLMLKGTLALMASYLLIATTGIERLCYALKLLHVPSVLVTQILLLYRYMTLLMREANAVMEAYALRAPNQKGVQYKVWGSLMGQLLLRSIDRANNLYESMLLRGFNGEFYYSRTQKSNQLDWVYLILWTCVILALRVENVLGLIF